VATVDGTSGGSPLVGRAAERATVDAIVASAAATISRTARSAVAREPRAVRLASRCRPLTGSPSK
jgi:hypothetical protein